MPHVGLCLNILGSPQDGWMVCDVPELRRNYTDNSCAIYIMIYSTYRQPQLCDQILPYCGKVGHVQVSWERIEW